MTKNSVWERAQKVNLQVSDNIHPELNIGFDKKIPEEIEKELRSFVKWFESNYRIPVTLYVDFEYRHYLVRRDGKRVGYLFYWSDFSSYPVFDKKEDIPMIRLPVRTEHSTFEEILLSFIEAISLYYAWICNEMHENFTVPENDSEEILKKYLKIF